MLNITGAGLQSLCIFIYYHLFIYFELPILFLHSLFLATYESYLILCSSLFILPLSLLLYILTYVPLTTLSRYCRKCVVSDWDSDYLTIAVKTGSKILSDNLANLSQPFKFVLRYPSNYSNLNRDLISSEYHMNLPLHNTTWKQYFSCDSYKLLWLRCLKIFLLVVWPHFTLVVFYVIRKSLLFPSPSWWWNSTLYWTTMSPDSPHNRTYCFKNIGLGTQRLSDNLAVHGSTRLTRRKAVCPAVWVLLFNTRVNDHLATILQQANPSAQWRYSMR